MTQLKSGPATGRRSPRPDGDGTASPEARELAEAVGLHPVGQRPSLRRYIADVWRRRHFVTALALSKARARTRSSRLGSLWNILNPIFNAGVYYLIFGLLLQTSRGVPNFIAYLVTGVFVIHFSSKAITGGARSITANLNIVQALKFPRAILPLSQTLLEFLMLAPALLVLFVIVVGTGEPITFNWLLLVPSLALQFCFTLGVAFILARMAAHTRDVLQVLPFVMRAWIYSSGVFYSFERFVEQPTLRAILELNPGAVYLNLARDALMESYTGYAHGWLLGAAWALLIIPGFIFFWRAEESYGHA